MTYDIFWRLCVACFAAVLTETYQGPCGRCTRVRIEKRKDG